MAAAVVTAMALTLLVPSDLRLGPAWLLPLVLGALLVALIVGDPGRIDDRSRRLRTLSIMLVAVLAADALWATASLIDSLIQGGPETNSASDLLSAGVVVWLLNIIVFALLYWELDAGGPAARAQDTPAPPEFGFPQQLNPLAGWEDWRPRFVDYLYLAFTNATAFSPTDAMPLAPWAKLAMLVQASISLAVLGLVVARAVNVLT